MAEDEVVRSGRWRPVNEGAQFLVGAADPNLEHPQLNVLRRGKAWLVALDDPDLARTGKNAHCSHESTTLAVQHVRNGSPAATNLLWDGCDEAVSTPYYDRHTETRTETRNSISTGGVNSRKRKRN